MSSSDRDGDLVMTHSSPDQSVPPAVAEAVAAAASSAASSSSAPGAAPASAGSSSRTPRGILKKPGSRKRSALVWNESNLASNEVERIERGPRIKIDEPKTPYQQSHSLRSPDALRLDDGTGAPHSPQSTNAAGMLPSELSLGDRLTEISAEALQRRESEWESDDDDSAASASQLDAANPGGAPAASSAGHRSNQSSVSSSAPAAAHAAHAHPHPHPSVHIDTERSDSAPSSAPGSASGSPRKHAEFASKRQGNYASMGALLKANKLKAQQDAAAEDDE